jgi:hypothetical protein
LKTSINTRRWPNWAENMLCDFKSLKFKKWQKCWEH